MLRIDDGKIHVDYQDPYLALTSLLVDAATLEHSLMASYLYALFSIKEEHDDLRGSLSPALFQPQPPTESSGELVAPPQLTFLEVTIEEMQHLALVNQLLRELGAAPCLERHPFPFVCEIYPFPLELRSLDRYAAATYAWIEASSTDVNLGYKAEGMAFRESLRQVIEEGRRAAGALPPALVAAGAVVPREHIGSLYTRILECLQILRHDPPAFLSPEFPWGIWTDRVRWIRDQGELRHFAFFRDVFTGKAFGADVEIWSDPISKNYPSISLPWRTAFSNRSDSIERGPQRDLAWLANLIYWTLLALLDVAYRRGARKLVYGAIEQMTSALWWLGLQLAREYGVGMPFDVMLVRYTLGRDDASTLAIIQRLVHEAKTRAKPLAKAGLLPILFDMQLFDRTLAALEDPGWSR